MTLIQLNQFGKRMLYNSKLVYIRTPRTASTSTKNFLLDHGFKLGSKCYHPEAKDVLKGRFTKLFSFSTVRNPWVRTVSAYHKRRAHDCFKRETDCPFSVWLTERLPKTLYGQVERLSDNNVILVDKLFTYENLDLLEKFLQEQLGTTDKLPSVNNIDYKPYQTYYDNNLRQLVAQRFAKDIELFGYKFDDPYPTKPIWEKNAL